jgi:hypothetical protein
MEASFTARRLKNTRRCARCCWNWRPWKTSKAPVFDPDDEAQMYLRVMAGGHVFNLRADPAEKLADIGTTEDLLKMAMGVERDSIAFYVGLKESVSQKAGRDRVEGIIREEMKHVAILNEKLDALKQAQ